VKGTLGGAVQPLANTNAAAVIHTARKVERFFDRPVERLRTMITDASIECIHRQNSA
jgi:hypothetical protein